VEETDSARTTRESELNMGFMAHVNGGRDGRVCHAVGLGAGRAAH